MKILLFPFLRDTKDSTGADLKWLMLTNTPAGDTKIGTKIGIMNVLVD